MGRKARTKREPRDHPRATTAVRLEPNWPLLALAAVGVALTTYLSYAEASGAALKGCSAGSGCDVVLSSKWATLLGQPTAVWGLMAYATLAASALVGRLDRWYVSWTVAFFGVAYSAYLTAVSLTILQSACPYCLTSLGLMTIIFALVTVQRPPQLSSFSWSGWLTKTVPVAAVLIGLLHMNYTGIVGEPPAVEDPQTRALAIHIAQSGAKVYGAYWCPHCQQQKEMFGASAKRLPYVECSTGGQGSPQTEACRVAQINIYPTWVIDGKRTEEVMTLDQLAAATGYRPAPAGQE